MTTYLIVCPVAALVSLLSFFSGFGLGTILMPVFAIFFPLPVAIAATAIVHFANNIFKLALVGTKANWGVVLKFALPAALSAFAGAWLLHYLSGFSPLFSYDISSRSFTVTPIKLVMSLLIISFSVLELMPAFNNLTFPSSLLPVGGAISGFFGGLSGHQGAFRSAFLIRLGLSKEAFVGTGAVTASIVDLSRLAVYGFFFLESKELLLKDEISGLVTAAALAAFIGAFIGKKLVAKITISAVQKIVSVSLCILGICLGLGLI